MEKNVKILIFLKDGGMLEFLVSSSEAEKMILALENVEADEFSFKGIKIKGNEITGITTEEIDHG